MVILQHRRWDAVFNTRLVCRKNVLHPADNRTNRPTALEITRLPCYRPPERPDLVHVLLR